MTAAHLEHALRRADGAPSILAYLTAGFPTHDAFLDALAAIERAADAVEIGIPFSDPMADGATIQRSSTIALRNGATLSRTLDALAARPAARPRVLMSYLGPLLALPHDTLAPRLAAARVSGLVVPDLPHDEADALRGALAASDVALVPMVTPVTRGDRSSAIARTARGFVYAVTATGTTGRGTLDPAAVAPYLARVRDASPVPVVAGFGIRSRDHVRALCPPADGVVVGSALVESLEAGVDLGAAIQALR